ncbi:sulfur carrier protein ThiS [Hathewaya massiliensis]|uniref:sulfur carrier protein ThiS n=1 Tax=Hathewaya massiliensis TaxID=1964382 RepID=UPI001FAA6885|nr:sulfur carrier protein ThiS [Hathewaya massiliensis]
MKEGENMKVNGRDFSIEGINNISDLLKKLNVNESRVVVELNKKIVSKEDYSKVNLKDDDTIEVVSFVGGG